MAEEMKLPTQSPSQNASWGDMNPHPIFFSPSSPTMWVPHPAFYSVPSNDSLTQHQLQQLQLQQDAMNSFAPSTPQPIPVPLATASSSRGANSSRSNSRPASAASSPLSEADLRTSRRRAQNRIAQRTYRARKENTIKEHEQRSAKLEKEVSDLKMHNAKLEYGIHCLKNQVMELQKSVNWWRKLASDNRFNSSSPIQDEDEDDRLPQLAEAESRHSC